MGRGFRGGLSSSAAGGVGFGEGKQDTPPTGAKKNGGPPAMSEETRQFQYHQWQKAVTKTFDWVE